MESLEGPDSEHAKSLKSRVAQGAIWTVSVNGAVNMIAVVSQIVLARLLVPEDFGLVALAGVIVTIVELLSRFSFNIALIHKQTNDRAYFDSAWTVTVLMAVITGMLLVVFAKPISLFYGDPRIEPIVYLFALGAVIRGMSNIGIVVFQKELLFRREFIYTVSQKLSGFLVTIPLAIIFRSYWALVAGMFAFWISGVALSYWIHPFRPRISFAKTIELLQFSRWILVNNVLIWLSTQSVPAMIGRAFGMAEVGFYGMAKQFVNLVSEELAGPIARAVFPGFAKVSRDHERLARGFLLSLSAVALLVAPCCIGFALVADPFVNFVLGSKWSAIIDLAIILSFAGLFGVFQENGQAVFMAIGRPEVSTYVLATRAALTVCAVVVGLSLGDLRLTMFGILTAQVGALAVTFAWLVRLLPLSIANCLNAVIRPMIGCGVLFACISGVDAWLVESIEASAFVRLAIEIPAGILAYAGTVFVAWSLSARKASGEKEIYDLAKNWMANLNKKSPAS